MRPFITKRGFLVKGHQEFSRNMTEKCDSAADGETIHMNIERRHENADLNRFTLQEFIVADLPNLHDLAIRGCDNQILTCRSYSFRITKKIQCEQEQAEKDHKHPHPQPLPFQKMPDNQRTSDGQRTNNCNNVVPVPCDHLLVTTWTFFGLRERDRVSRVGA